MQPYVHGDVQSHPYRHLPLIFPPFRIHHLRQQPIEPPPRLRHPLPSLSSLRFCPYTLPHAPFSRSPLSPTPSLHIPSSPTPSPRIPSPPTPSASTPRPPALWPVVFLGFSPDAPGCHSYHPTSCHVFHSQDITFEESVPFYHLFPYPSVPPPPLPLFLAPGPPPVDRLLPQGPAPSGVSQVDPLPGTVPVEVAVGSSATRGAVSGGDESEDAGAGGAEHGRAGSWGAQPGGAEPGGAEPAGVEPGGVEPGGAEMEGAESGGAEPRGTASSGATAAGGIEVAGAGGAGVTTTAAGPGGARTRGSRAAMTGGVGGAGGAGAGGARDPSDPGGAGAASAGAGSTGAGGTRAGGAGAVDPGATGVGGIKRPRPYLVPLLQQVLGVPSSASLPPFLLCPPPNLSQPSLQPASALPAPSPYTEQSGGLTECREPASCPVSPVRTAHRVPRWRPPHVPGPHTMALRPCSVPLRVPLPPPPESSLPEVPDPGSDCARAASPTVSRLLATVVSNPSFESTAAFSLVAELVDFAAACRLYYAIALVAESVPASPPTVRGECALGTNVREDRQEDFEYLAAAVPRFASMLLAPEGDPDAPDIPTPCSYAKVIMGPYSSQWQEPMDAELASWKSTGTYVDEVPPAGVNILDDMWIFRVKRPPSSTPAFKARYVARGFSQRQGVD
ncbi:unnamed protein product [Closterium sp. NIES-54]